MFILYATLLLHGAICLYLSHGSSLLFTSVETEKAAPNLAQRKKASAQWGHLSWFTRIHFFLLQKTETKKTPLEWISNFTAKQILHSLWKIYSDMLGYYPRHLIYFSKPTTKANPSFPTSFSSKINWKGKMKWKLCLCSQVLYLLFKTPTEIKF